MLVVVGDTRYGEDDEGRIFAHRVGGGHAEFSPVGPNGETEWLASPLAPMN